MFHQRINTDTIPTLPSTHIFTFIYWRGKLLHLNFIYIMGQIIFHMMGLIYTKLDAWIKGFNTKIGFKKLTLSLEISAKMLKFGYTSQLISIIAQVFLSPSYCNLRMPEIFHNCILSVLHPSPRHLWKEPEYRKLVLQPEMINTRTSLARNLSS